MFQEQQRGDSVVRELAEKDSCIAALEVDLQRYGNESRGHGGEERAGIVLVHFG